MNYTKATMVFLMAMEYTVRVGQRSGSSRGFFSPGVFFLSTSFFMQELVQSESNQANKDIQSSSPSGLSINSTGSNCNLKGVAGRDPQRTGDKGGDFHCSTCSNMGNSAGSSVSLGMGSASGYSAWEMESE